MIATAFQIGPQGQAGRAMSAMAAPLSRACAVRLIDRRTGQAHRINGRPLVLFTRAPDLAVAELLAKRDPALLKARVDPLPTPGGHA